jgi:hypothetical protein
MYLAAAAYSPPANLSTYLIVGLICIIIGIIIGRKVG